MLFSVKWLKIVCSYNVLWLLSQYIGALYILFNMLSLKKKKFVIVSADSANW